MYSRLLYISYLYSFIVSFTVQSFRKPHVMSAIVKIIQSVSHLFQRSNMFSSVMPKWARNCSFYSNFLESVMFWEIMHTKQQILQKVICCSCVIFLTFQLGCQSSKVENVYLTFPETNTCFCHGTIVSYFLFKTFKTYPEWTDSQKLCMCVWGGGGGLWSFCRFPLNPLMHVSLCVCTCIVNSKVPAFRLRFQNREVNSVLWNPPLLSLYPATSTTKRTAELRKCGVDAQRPIIIGQSTLYCNINVNLTHPNKCK